MSSKSYKPMHDYTAAFAQDSGSDLLYENGFSSVCNPAFSWFRIKNNEIVNTVFFSSVYKGEQYSLDLNYGIYPLFCQLFLPTKVYEGTDFPPGYTPIRYLQRLGFSHHVTFGDHFFGKGNPKEVTRNIIQDTIIIMNRTHTVKDCYQWFKQVFLEKLNFINAIDLSFIDQVVYHHDTEMYSLCQERIKYVIPICDSLCQEFPTRLAYQKDFALWKLAEHAINDNARDDYLKMLESRKHKNVAMLKKKYGIT